MATWARTRSRRSTTCRAVAAASRPRGGANFGWSAFEGRSRYNDGSASAPRGRPSITHTPRWRLELDHRRVRSARPLAARAALRGGATSTATSPSRTLRLAFLKRPRAPTQRDRAARGEPGFLRRGRPRQGLRCVDRRTDLPDRTAMRRADRGGAWGYARRSSRPPPRRPPRSRVAGSKSCYRAGDALTLNGAGFTPISAGEHHARGQGPGQSGPPTRRATSARRSASESLKRREHPHADRHRRRQPRQRRARPSSSARPWA